MATGPGLGDRVVFRLLLLLPRHQCVSNFDGREEHLFSLVEPPVKDEMERPPDGNGPFPKELAEIVASPFFSLWQFASDVLKPALPSFEFLEHRRKIA